MIRLIGYTKKPNKVETRHPQSETRHRSINRKVALLLHESKCDWIKVLAISNRYVTVDILSDRQDSHLRKCARANSMCMVVLVAQEATSPDERSVSGCRMAGNRQASGKVEGFGVSLCSSTRRSLRWLQSEVTPVVTAASLHLSIRVRGYSGHCVIALIRRSACKKVEALRPITKQMRAGHSR